MDNEQVQLPISQDEDSVNSAILQFFLDLKSEGESIGQLQELSSSLGLGDAHGKLKSSFEKISAESVETFASAVSDSSRARPDGLEDPLQLLVKPFEVTNKLIDDISKLIRPFSQLDPEIDPELKARAETLQPTSAQSLLALETLKRQTQSIWDQMRIRLARHLKNGDSVGQQEVLHDYFERMRQIELEAGHLSLQIPQQHYAFTEGILRGADPLTTVLKSEVEERKRKSEQVEMLSEQTLDLTRKIDADLIEKKQLHEKVDKIECENKSISAKERASTKRSDELACLINKDTMLQTNAKGRYDIKCLKVILDLSPRQIIRRISDYNRVHKNSEVFGLFELEGKVWGTNSRADAIEFIISTNKKSRKKKAEPMEQYIVNNIIGN